MYEGGEMYPAKLPLQEHNGKVSKWQTRVGHAAAVT